MLPIGRSARGPITLRIKQPKRGEANELVTDFFVLPNGVLIVLDRTFRRLLQYNGFSNTTN